MRAFSTSYIWGRVTLARRRIFGSSTLLQVTRVLSGASSASTARASFSRCVSVVGAKSSTSTYRRSPTCVVLRSVWLGWWLVPGGRRHPPGTSGLRGGLQLDAGQLRVQRLAGVAVAGRGI